MENKRGIPIPTIKRFPSYLRLLNVFKEEGREMASATMLAEELNLKPIQVRKDISFTGIEGKPKVGFEVDKLINAIISVLGWDNATDAIIIGAGHLGSALARYEGFGSYGLRIVAAFDTAEEKWGTNVGMFRSIRLITFTGISKKTTSISPCSPFRRMKPST